MSIPRSVSCPCMIIGIIMMVIGGTLLNDWYSIIDFFRFSAVILLILGFIWGCGCFFYFINPYPNNDKYDGKVIA